MTQEELDALMAGGLDDLDDSDSKKESTQEKSTQEESVEEETTENGVEVQEPADEEIGKAIKDDAENGEEADTQEEDGQNYRADANMAWPPPPPTDDHKMVTQLDDVTKDSEVKATQIFDKLDEINNILMEMESDIEVVSGTVGENIALFEKLVQKFPNIKQFKDVLQSNLESKEKLETMTSSAQMGEDEVMMAMDIMQYQDIHRQKIERVINVMRALSKYISLLFEGSIDDDKRVSSAVHIHGDENTEDLVTTDDIEAIIESLGKKK